MECGEEMKLSIITPTILRTTLTKCIESVAMQSYQDYEHILVVDRPDTVIPENPEWMSPRIRWVMCGRHHNNYGNTPRRLGVQAALGEYITYLDDDDLYLMDSSIGGAMRSLEKQGWPVWGCVQMVVNYDKRPAVFTGMPPVRGKVGSCMIWHRRVMLDGAMPMFPDSKEYTADGIFAEELAAKYGNPAILSDEPVVCVSGVGGGKWF